MTALASFLPGGWRRRLPRHDRGRRALQGAAGWRVRRASRRRRALVQRLHGAGLLHGRHGDDGPSTGAITYGANVTPRQAVNNQIFVIGANDAGAARQLQAMLDRNARRGA
jgi:hypothetical protein